MKFSIIIPAHNEEQTIGKALESVFTQSFRNFEVIVVCDSCTDNTRKIADSWGAKIVDVDCHMSGLSRNAGLDVAQGDWILFLDADDWYLHEYVLQMLSDNVGKHDEDVLIFSIIWRGIGYGPIRSSKGTIFPHVCNKCWRRSSVGNTRFRRGIEFAEDEAFFKDMLSKQIKIVEWDMPMYYYNYLRPGSKSKNIGRNVNDTIQYWSTH